MTSDDKSDRKQLALKNDFKYGDMFNTNIVEPNRGVCPLGGHIRKANIRIGLNNSRIMRRGIPYGNDFQRGAVDGGRGLLFAAYQSTIEDGYKFIQTHWANNPNFPSKGSGFDVTIGQGTGDLNPFTIGSKTVDINPVNEFVTFKGGEYFFAPSMSVLKAGFDINKLPKAKL